MFSLVYGGHWKVKNVLPGALFWFPDGGMALMTEYGGRAYLLRSGEACHVDPETVVIVLDVEDNDPDVYLWDTDRKIDDKGV